ncbi:MAG: hypothetical protein SPI15_01400 [Candidatus Faecousia sp.]|nr:hypothetical protein [Clostridiales bacterium]MDY6179482.1 hypothetical protein [Candidatus Faecousia sp.]
MKSSFIRYFTALLASTVIGITLLFAASCLPQAPIDTHVMESADIMVQEGCYPSIADHNHTSIIDNFTDSIILAESSVMTISHPESILTNPLYRTVEDDPVTSLNDYVHSDDPHITGYYARYWMGSRSVMRFLLLFLNHYQIRRYLAIAVLGLFSAVICSVTVHVHPKAAFLFALSVVFVRPYIVVMSPHFSCCFLIAFLVMLLLPKLVDQERYDGLLFFEIGIITMYFDFYSSPLVTFGLPFVYLYILRWRRGRKSFSAPREFVKSAAAWLAGYLGMWFIKMTLTTVFTEVNGFENGLTSLVYRLGIKKTQGYESFYSLFRAIRAIWFALYSDKAGKIILSAAILAFTIVICTVFLRRKVSFSDLKAHAVLLIVSALPLVWMLAAPQPTTIHYWFQYRSISVSFWSFGMYCLLTAKSMEKPISGRQPTDAESTPSRIPPVMSVCRPDEGAGEAIHETEKTKG